MNNKNKLLDKKMAALACLVWLFYSSMVAVEAMAEIKPERSEKRISLTFDDAPRGNGPFFSGSERTLALIDALASVEVSGAMFFVSTGNIEKSADGTQRLRDYVTAGHHLANHSHTHPWLWKSDASEYLADIDLASEILESLPGYQPFYRFPFLDEGRTQLKHDAVREGLAERGLSNGYVTVDNYDWYMQALVSESVRAGYELDQEKLRRAYVDLLIQSIDFYDEIARDQLGRSPAHVLLLHENDLAALFIDDLVIELRRQGWSIISAVEAYRDEIAQMQPDTLFNGQGRVAALAHEQGQSPRALIHVSEDENWLRAEFIRRGVLNEPDKQMLE